MSVQQTVRPLGRVGEEVVQADGRAGGRACEGGRAAGAVYRVVLTEWWRPGAPAASEKREARFVRIRPGEGLSRSLSWKLRPRIPDLT